MNQQFLRIERGSKTSMSQPAWCFKRSICLTNEFIQKESEIPIGRAIRVPKKALLEWLEQQSKQEEPRLTAIRVR